MCESIGWEEKEVEKHMGEFPQLLGDLWPILDDGDIYVWLP